MPLHEKKPDIIKYKCVYPDCHREFRQMWILRDHMRTHCNQYKFTCNVNGCTKKYNTRSNLEVHLRKHAGIKPFQCPGCHKWYISKWNMAKHRNKGCIMNKLSDQELAHKKSMENLQKLKRPNEKVINETMTATRQAF